MRKVVYGGATSLDQYLAREDGAVDWLIMDAEAMELMAGMWDRFDVMVMGRKTWSVSMEQFSEEDLKKAEEMASGMRSYVFSRTLKAEKKGGYEIVNDDPVEFVRRLKYEGGDGASTISSPEAGATPPNQGGEPEQSKPALKDICVMGGGEIGSLLLDAGLVDEVGFNIHPVLLGSGVPAFTKMSRQIDLELIECKAMKSGCVYVLYKVKNQ